MLEVAYTHDLPVRGDRKTLAEIVDWRSKMTDGYSLLH